MQFSPAILSNFTPVLTYHPADSLLRFHYAIIRANQARLLRANADPRSIWGSLRDTFQSQVLGPAFEATAREWTRHVADATIFDSQPAHVGTSVIALDNNEEVQLDVVVAAEDAQVASERTILAVGEAKVGRSFDFGHRSRLAAAKAALGPRAANAKLLAFGAKFTADVRAAANKRHDVELIDTERLYGTRDD